MYKFKQCMTLCQNIYILKPLHFCCYDHVWAGTTENFEERTL